MSTQPVHDDVFDPTTDPRHRPPTELPGEDPDVARPRHVDPAAPPPPDEPVIARPGSTPTPRAKPADGAD
jgi:hypothetical protein